MKKFFSIFFGLLVVVMFAATTLMADTALQNKHKGKKKGSEAVGCVFCHGTASAPKIAKKKGLGDQKGQAMCKGAGCH